MLLEKENSTSDSELEVDLGILDAANTSNVEAEVREEEMEEENETDQSISNKAASNWSTWSPATLKMRVTPVLAKKTKFQQAQAGKFF